MRLPALIGFVALTALISAAYAVHSNGSALVLHNEEMHESEFSAYSAAALAALEKKRAVLPVASSTPQFVVLSFDGSKSIAMLRDTLEFQRTLKNQGVDVRFTYFINAAYLLTKQTAKAYVSPQGVGTSAIGFSTTAADIAKRIEAFNDAYASGNEIASHSAGHYNGQNWSAASWRTEFSAFEALVRDVQKNNPTVSVPAPLFSTSIVGFRAPELGVNEHLYTVEKEFGFTYDSSGVGFATNWPTQDAHGIWHIPLGTIFIGPSRRPAVAMDYSLWMHQSQGKDILSRNTKEWQQKHDEVVDAYRRYFEGNYRTNRAPVVIGNHFSLWNDGLYWEAMKTFATEVCGKPQVRCTTFKELTAYLNEHGAAQ